MIELKGLRTAPECNSISELRIEAARKLRISPENIQRVTILRRSIDARKQGRIRLEYTLLLELSKGKDAVLRREAGASIYRDVGLPTILPGSRPMKGRPVVVGMGPAGLFAAITLAKAGYSPIVLERGAPMEERIALVQHYFSGGILNPKANVAFGEGGAGTFSDGKLTTRIKDPLCREVLEAFVSSGADPDILYQQKAHIGTDVLRRILPNLRKHLIASGGEVRFYSCADKILTSGGRLIGLKLSDGTTLDTRTAIWATGHSARDSYRMLEQLIPLEAKPSAMGIRIEHLQSWLDACRYGKYAGNPVLGPADYHLNFTIGDRGVYSFCMCPGGVVVNASHEAESICVNGMSLRARDGDQCNAAIVVQVSPRDYGDDGNSALSGLVYQERMERAAFVQGEGLPPAQRLEDFLAGRKSHSFGSIKPTVRPGATPTNVYSLLPPEIGESIKASIPFMEQKLPGFAFPDAVITGVETRTSSPVRIPRGANGCAEGMEGLYPVGEGAGYAGGIMSSAVDGIRAARQLISAYQRP